MKWITKSKDEVIMINLDRIDAYEYFIIDEPPKKIHGNHMRVFVNGSLIELNGDAADDLYNMLNATETNVKMD